MVPVVRSHTNATSKRWHLWGIDLKFALNSTLGWIINDSLPISKVVLAAHSGRRYDFPLLDIKILQYHTIDLKIDFERN